MAADRDERLAGLDMEKEMTEWKTIDTAPKDGTQVLLWSAMWEMSWGVVLGHFEQGPTAGVWITSEGDAAENEPGYDPDAEADEDDEDFDLDSDRNMGPTHWHPVPEPPAAY